VTKDKAIKRTPQYRAIIAEARIGAFFISTGKARQLTGWETAKLLIKAWDDMLRYSQSHDPPFPALVQRSGRVSGFRSSR
jgi:hypothetical protein